jgi:hypothetical protein
MSTKSSLRSSPAHGSAKEWDVDNLPPRGFGGILFLKNGIPCQDLPILMPELRLPKLEKEVMPTTRESSRNSMVSGEHDVDTPWADLPALFLSIASDSRAKVEVNVGQMDFNFMENDLYRAAAAGVTMEGMHGEIQSIMGNAPEEFTAGFAAELELDDLEEYRTEFNELIAKAPEPLSPSEQRAIEAKRRKMKAFCKIAALSNMGDGVKEMDIENPDPTKLRELMGKIVGQKPVKVETDENRCRFYRKGESCDCPTFTKSAPDGEDAEICICGHHKMYHKSDLNENLSTQERPMWYATEDAKEFWERDEARDVLQECAMESMVSQTRWRTVTDPSGATCFYNLKTGDITYDPPKSVPWRYAAETYAKAFPPINDEEDDPEDKKKSTSQLAKSKTKGMTRKQKTAQKQATTGRSALPGAVVDDESLGYDLKRLSLFSAF